MWASRDVNTKEVYREGSIKSTQAEYNLQKKKKQKNNYIDEKCTLVGGRFWYHQSICGIKIISAFRTWDNETEIYCYSFLGNNVFDVKKKERERESIASYWLLSTCQVSH